jgi:hypothetical protein
MGKTRQPVATGFSKSLRVESRTERLTWGGRQDRGANRSVLRAAALERGARAALAESAGRRPRRLTRDVDSLPIDVHGHQPKAEWNGHYRGRIYPPSSSRSPKPATCWMPACVPVPSVPPRGRWTSSCPALDRLAAP